MFPDQLKKVLNYSNNVARLKRDLERPVERLEAVANLKAFFNGTHAKSHAAG